MAAGSSYSVGQTGGSIDHNHEGTTDGHNHPGKGGEDISSSDPQIHSVSTTDTDTFETQRSDNLPTFRATAYIMYRG